MHRMSFVAMMALVGLLQGCFAAKRYTNGEVEWYGSATSARSLAMLQLVEMCREAVSDTSGRWPVQCNTDGRDVYANVGGHNLLYGSYGVYGAGGYAQPGRSAEGVIVNEQWRQAYGAVTAELTAEKAARRSVEDAFVDYVKPQ